MEKTVGFVVLCCFYLQGHEKVQLCENTTRSFKSFLLWFSVQFQELQVERETLLTSNRGLAEESLARRPRLNNGKLQLAEKYSELSNLATSCWEKRSQIGEWTRVRAKGFMFWFHVCKIWPWIITVETQRVCVGGGADDKVTCSHSRSGWVNMSLCRESRSIFLFFNLLTAVLSVWPETADWPCFLFFPFFFLTHVARRTFTVYPENKADGRKSQKMLKPLKARTNYIRYSPVAPHCLPL